MDDRIKELEDRIRRTSELLAETYQMLAEDWGHFTTQFPKEQALVCAVNAESIRRVSLDLEKELDSLRVLYRHETLK